MAKDRGSSGMHPHPEALYYHVAGDAVASVGVEQDEFRRKELVATALYSLRYAWRPSSPSSTMN